MASSTAISAPAGTIEGVPPPKKTLVASAIPAATERLMSVMTAAR
jgi:hypothetical protein